MIFRITKSIENVPISELFEDFLRYGYELIEDEEGYQEMLIFEISTINSVKEIFKSEGIKHFK